MKKILCLISIMSVISGCQPVRESSLKGGFDDLENPDKISSYNSSNDIKIKDGYTIDALAKISLSEGGDQKLFDIIKNEGINVTCIPDGISKGKPGRFDSNYIPENSFTERAVKILFKVLGNKASGITADILWDGKNFKRDTANCSKGTGINRVGFSKIFTLKTFTLSSAKYINNADFNSADNNETLFLEALAENRNHVSLVELNYSESGKNPANILDRFQIKDIMVPIQGKNGIVWLGRAYAVNWTSKTTFKSTGLLAWFFLDFNAK